MFGASPYLYMGKERINHQHYYDEFDDEREENFNYVLDNAEDIKNMLIRGSMKQINDDGKKSYLRSVESKVKRDAEDLHRLWFNMKMGSKFMR
jgi:hypothetical protein